MAVVADDRAKQTMQDNSEYLAKKVASDTSIYGVNTGYGGSADVCSPDTAKVSRTTSECWFWEDYKSGDSQRSDACSGKQSMSQLLNRTL